jgi:flavin reductase (DIM6/NTAB) family NADH-FMN oxidoreductase RutF
MTNPAERVAVALSDPGGVTRVVLEGLDAPLDVSGDHLAVSAEPLTIGLCLDASVNEDQLRGAQLRLVFQDWDAPDRRRGVLKLRVQQAVGLPGTQRRLWVFGVVGAKNYCLAWFRRSTALDVYYMRPRPVSMVTVRDGRESDYFPVDWTGAISSGHFVLALRSTTPAIRLIRHSRRMAVSAVPASFKYTLASTTVTSMEFALPVPRDALFVREVEISAAHRIHSHTLFVTDIARVTCSTDDDALCHIAGAYALARGLASVR